jgi:SAM-dependent methyltransferase
MRRKTPIRWIHPLRIFFKNKEDEAQKSESIFTQIFEDNKWHGTDSISGTGSDCVQTRIIIDELPKLFKELGIKSLLDIPCGDFHWMQKVDLGGIKYLGADIVKELINENRRRTSKENIDFIHLNLTLDPLPEVDLVLCRDCLVHLSYEHIFLALRNLSQSKSKYLLTTTFPDRSGNCDIPTGDWRPINLEKAPFNLKRPLRIINEGCTEFDGAFKDKSLGLWRIDDILQGLVC